MKIEKLANKNMFVQAFIWECLRLQINFFVLFNALMHCSRNAEDLIYYMSCADENALQDGILELILAAAKRKALTKDVIACLHGLTQGFNEQPDKKRIVDDLSRLLKKQSPLIQDIFNLFQIKEANNILSLKKLCKQLDEDYNGLGYKILIVRGILSLKGY